MDEHGYSRKLRKGLQDTGRIFQWKINDPYAGGVPDKFIEGPNRDLWLESKHIKELPKRGSTVIDLCNEKQYLSKLQQIWLKRRSDVRGDAAVLVSCPEGAILFLHKEWELPLTTEEFRKRVSHFDAVVSQILALT